VATYRYTFNPVDIKSITSVDSYSSEDENLIDNFQINSSFDQKTNYIELHYYSLDGGLLGSVDFYQNIKSPQDSGTANGGTLDAITLNVEDDIKARGYEYGDVYLVYNFLNDPYTDSVNKEPFFLEEISPDRFEIRILSRNLSNQQVLTYTNKFKDRLSKSDVSEFKIGLGENRFLLATNIDTLEYKEYTSVVIRLYNQLPEDLSLKQVLYICEEVADSAGFSVDTEITPDEVKIPYIKGPNFTAEEVYGKNHPTQYYNINELFNYPVTSSYYEVRSIFEEKGAEVTIDYSDYSDFIHFSSAYERLSNFKYKLDLIASYQSSSNARTNATSSVAAFSGSKDYYEGLIENILTNFDHYDRYLYFESSSYSWPKIGNSKPYTIDYGANGTQWYSGQLVSASNYDVENPHQLLNSVPAYLREDTNNSRYNLFIHMVGQHFDNLWIYAKNVTDKYDGDNRLTHGISKDLVEHALQNFGVRLYTSNRTTQELFSMFTGETYSTGREKYVTLITGSNEVVSEENYKKQIYKRLYHNLPFLLKTKGTERGLRALFSTFGIPSLYSSGSFSGLMVKQYGGTPSGSFNLAGEYYVTSSLGKIRIDNTGSLIPSGSYTTGHTLSKYVSIEKRDNKYSRDVNSVEVGFSPTDYINNYIISGATAEGFDINSIIGDPRYAFSSSYNALDLKIQQYLAPVINLANQNSGSIYNLKDFTRLLKFYDNVLFKTIKDFVPARTNLSTGIIIKPHLLERSKARQVKNTFELHNTFTGSISIGTYSGSDGGAYGNIQKHKASDYEWSGSEWSGVFSDTSNQYRTSYTETVFVPTGVETIYRHNHEEAKYNGELSGSYLKLSDGELNRDNSYKYDEARGVRLKYNVIDANADCEITWGIYTPAVITSPTATPTPTSTPANSPAATVTVTPTVTPTITPTITPTRTPGGSPTPTPTKTITPSPSTLNFYAFEVSYASSEGGQELAACANTDTFLVYSLCQTIVLPGDGPCFLYYTPSTENPVDPGYYADKGNGKYYYTETSTGLVEEIGLCSLSPTPSATPQCTSYALELVAITSLNEEGICNGTITPRTVYLNTNDLATATISYGSSTDCTIQSGIRYYALPGGTEEYYIWNGTMNGPYSIQCP